MIEFRFETLRLDGNRLETDWDVLLRLVADFSIILPDVAIPLYREEEFCVVEFAMQITQWLASLDLPPNDFSYNSVESDETGLVVISKQEHGWKIAALHQDYSEDRLFKFEEIEGAIRAFVTSLQKTVEETFQRDISHLVSGRPLSL